MIAHFRRLPGHARVVLAGLLLLTGFACLFVLGKLGSFYLEHERRVGDMEPRIARLLGYMESVEALRGSVARVGAELDGLVLAADVDAGAAGASVQQQARRIMEAAGMSVVGSQVVRTLQHEYLEEIRVALSVSGSMEALDQALGDLANARPMLLVQTIEIVPVNVRRGDNTQAANIDITLRAVRLL